LDSFDTLNLGKNHFTFREVMFISVTKLHKKKIDLKVAKNKESDPAVFNERFW